MSATEFAAVRDALPPSAASDPEKPETWADKLARVLEREKQRTDESLVELRQLHADLLGCPVEDLDRVIGEQEAQRTAAREAARASRPTITVEPTRRSRSAKPNKSPEPPRAMRRLTERQQELLSCLIVEGDRAVFGPDNHIDDWPALKQVMLLLGATWKTGGKGKGGAQRKGAFVFPADVDAAEMLRLAQQHGEVFDPTLAGFFASPDAVADRAAGKLVLAPSMRVLEPSAGRGSLALALLRRNPRVIVECVELLEAHQAELRAMKLPIIGTDFLAMKPNDHTMFDAALMNPPFNKGAEAHHVLHAARFLVPGGQLVSIVSAGVVFREDGPYRDLAAWVRAHGEVEKLPPGSFKESGTMINTALITAKACGWCRSGICLERR
jgi:hypothetical protein